MENLTLLQNTTAAGMLLDICTGVFVSVYSDFTRGLRMRADPATPSCLAPSGGGSGREWGQALLLLTSALAAVQVEAWLEGRATAAGSLEHS